MIAMMPDDPTSGSGRHRARWVAGATLALTAIAVATTLVLFDREDEVPSTSGSDEVSPTSPSLEEIAAAASCQGIEDMGYFVGPVRGGAAARGISCTTPTGEMDIFERNPISSRIINGSRIRSGGSMEHIDRNLGTGSEDGPCAYLLVGRSWFIVAEDPRSLRAVVDEYGGVRPIVETGPTVSYIMPGGCAPDYRAP